jgi:hypothetical protein
MPVLHGSSLLLDLQLRATIPATLVAVVMPVVLVSVRVRAAIRVEASAQVAVAMPVEASARVWAAMPVEASARVRAAIRVEASAQEQARALPDREAVGHLAQVVVIVLEAAQGQIAQVAAHRVAVLSAILPQPSVALNHPKKRSRRRKKLLNSKVSSPPCWQVLCSV